MERTGNASKKQCLVNLINRQWPMRRLGVKIYKSINDMTRVLLINMVQIYCYTQLYECLMLGTR